jgi:hypothetical protein
MQYLTAFKIKNPCMTGGTIYDLKRDFWLLKNPAEACSAGFL